MPPTAAKSKKPAVQEAPLWDRITLWYDTNTHWINIILAIILIAVAGKYCYTYLQNSKVTKANRDYSLVLQQLGEAAQTDDAKKKEDSLQGAVTAAQKLESDYPDAYLGRHAQLMIGNAYYSLANNESAKAGGKGVEYLKKALDAYEKYLSLAKEENEKAAANLAIGNTRQDLLFVTQDSKQYQNSAEDAYKQAIGAGKGTFLAAEAKMSLARLYLGQNDSKKQAEAVQLLSSVSKDRALDLKTPEKSIDIKLPTGQDLTKEQIRDIHGLAEWSQQDEAKKALKRFE